MAGHGRGRKKRSDAVEAADVAHGVPAGCAPDGTLVDVDHIMGNASRQSVELAGLVGAFAGLALKGGHEDVGDERRFARTRDACDGDDGPHRNGHVDVAEIVF